MADNLNNKNRSEMWKIYKEITKNNNILQSLQWRVSSEDRIKAEIVKISLNLKNKDIKKNINDNITKKKNMDITEFFDKETQPLEEEEEEKEEEEEEEEEAIYQSVYNVETKELLGLNNKHYVSKKVIRHLIKENGYNNNLVSDISKVDYNKYYEQKHKKLEPIGVRFIDNIMLFSLVQPQYLEKGRGGQLKLLQREYGNINIKIKEKFIKYKIDVVKKGGVTGKNPLFLYGKDGAGDTRKFILKTLDKRPEIKKFYIRTCFTEEAKNKIVAVPYKVELADIPADEVIDKLPLILEELKEHNIWLMDADYTQDYRGNLHQEELKNYLLSRGFRMEKTARRENKTIIDNDKSVGNNCLTFVTEFKDVKIRCKLYNKYVCQLTSGSVNNVLGCHLLDLVQHKTETLRTTFNNGEMTGVTRLEITFYSNKLYDKQFYNNALDYLEELTANKPLFYHTPFKNQFKALEEQIDNSLCIFDRTTETFYYIYYVNLLTGKLTGIRYENRRKKNPVTCKKEFVPYTEEHINKRKNLIISSYSYKNKPIYYLEITHTADSITVTKETYLKLEGDTYLTNPVNFDTATLENDEINFNRYGLNYGEIKFRVRGGKRGNVNSKLPYEFIELKEDSKKVSLLSKKKRDLIEQKIRDAEQFNKTNKTLNLEKEKYEQILKDVIDRENKRTKIDKKITDIYDKLGGVAKSLINLKIGETIDIIAYKRFVAHYGVTYVILTNDNRLFRADTCVEKICGKEKEKEVEKGVKYTTNKGDVFFGGKILYTVLFSLTKQGEKWNKHKTKSNYYKIFTIWSNFSENAKKEKEIERIADRKNLVKDKLNTLSIDYTNKAGLKTKDCLKMETLELDKNYKIHALIPVEYRKKKKYIFSMVQKTENGYYNITNYVSNSFLEDKIKSLDINNKKDCILFRTIKLKTHGVSKKKEMWIS